MSMISHLICGTSTDNGYSRLISLDWLKNDAC